MPTDPPLPGICVDVSVIIKMYRILLISNLNQVSTLKSVERFT